MSETHAGAQSYRAGPWSCRLSDCLDPEPHIHSQQSLADNIDALKAENEALKREVAREVKHYVDYFAALKKILDREGIPNYPHYLDGVEHMARALKRYTSWTTLDPGTKEAMEWFREPGPFEADAHGRVLAHALRAAMVRLEEAEKKGKENAEYWMNRAHERCQDHIVRAESAEASLSELRQQGRTTTGGGSGDAPAGNIICEKHRDKK